MLALERELELLVLVMDQLIQQQLVLALLLREVVIHYIGFSACL